LLAYHFVLYERSLTEFTCKECEIYKKKVSSLLFFDTNVVEGKHTKKKYINFCFHVILSPFEYKFMYEIFVRKKCGIFTEARSERSRLENW
jgi:hypothetical protein